MSQQKWRKASRVEWLDYIADSLSEGRHDFTDRSLRMAHAFTHGNFNYVTGRQTRHVSYGYLELKAGVRKGDKTNGSGKRFFQQATKAGVIQRIQGTGKKLVAGEARQTFLHQLRVPEWWHRTNAAPEVSGQPPGFSGPVTAMPTQRQPEAAMPPMREYVEPPREKTWWELRQEGVEEEPPY